MNFLQAIFGGIGNSVLGDIQSAENYALAGFSVLAGEMLILILLVGAILLWGIAVL